MHTTLPTWHLFINYPLSGNFQGFFLFMQNLTTFTSCLLLLQFSSRVKTRIKNNDRKMLLSLRFWLNLREIIMLRNPIFTKKREIKLTVKFHASIFSFATKENAKVGRKIQEALSLFQFLLIADILIGTFYPAYLSQ